MLKTNLLPLKVPIGKPLLSCNATQLLQSQINLDGIIYDCNGGAITKSCPRVDAHNFITDECHGESLECDVRMRSYSRSVSCTNGTLISSHPIICKSATLLENKNILNCIYDNGGNAATVGHRPSRPTLRPSSPVTTLRTSVIPLDPVTEINGIFVRVSENEKNKKMPLNNQVENAMTNIFPYELLSVGSKQMYLPPQTMDQSNQRFPQDVKDHLNGVFPHNLFAMSQSEDSFEYDDIDDKSSRLSGRTSGKQKHASISVERKAQWDINANRKTGNSDGSSKKTFNSRLPTRFGSDSEPTLEDRLVFTP